MRTITYLLVFLLSACASNEANIVSEGVTGQEGEPIVVAQAKKKSKKLTLICTRETVLGTHFSRRVCRTPQEIEIERETMEEEFDRLGRQN